MATATARKLRPLGVRVVFQRTPREEMTKSGIVVRLTHEGTREPKHVKEGDTVLYAKYAGTEFKIEGDELLIVSQKDILAIVDNA